MADPSGVGAALAVEAVEWAPENDEKLTVSVRGRWRRRRPVLGGQPVLVVEAEGRRHRFTATPEPPSLAGAPPGSWQMTFSVPGWFAPFLGGRIWLQLGLAIVPLPRAVGPPLPDDVAHLQEPGSGLPPQAPHSADAETLIDRRVRTAELAEQRARERQADAEEAVAELTIRALELEQALEHARREPGRLRKMLADRDQQLRAAEQRAHSERAMRLEREDLLDRERDADQEALRIDAGELAAAEARVRELERELEQLQRQIDRAPPAGPPRAFDLSLELALVESTALPRSEDRPELARPASDVGGPADRRALIGERALITARGARIAPGVAQAQGSTGSDAVAAVLAELRAEFEHIKGLALAEAGRGAQARARVEELERRVDELESELHERDARSVRAFGAVQELRELVAVLRGERLAMEASEEMPADPDPDASVELERFDAALSRLRASIPSEPQGAVDSEPVPALEGPDASSVAPWLRAAFSSMFTRDPDSAGRLLVGLLPLQRAPGGGALAYDLVLDEQTCVHVTAADGDETPEIVRARTPRDLAEVAFRVTGTYAELARLITAGPLRRALRRGLPRVQGDRRALPALTELTRLRVSLAELDTAGVRLDPPLTFALVACMVRPGWTAGERFTIAHDPGTAAGTQTYLHVRRGELVTVTDAPPLGPVATTIVCAPGALLAVLADDPAANATVRGDAGALLALLGWLERAQRES
jgi:hypothetical protein